ncbi:MAG: carboxylating nicotinate-nucleotide diphosphorylase [Nitrospirae bacterium]|nr:carboxylating nicotinate-nucleotide diphosphorylase [Nitrospirota bacterium]
MKYLSIDAVLLNALMEDIGHGDVTTSAVIPADHKSIADIIAKEDFTLAGIPFTERIFNLVNKDIKFKANKKDGDSVKKGTVIARVSGNTRSLLMAERVALNLLQRLSGIATFTRRFVECVRGFSVKIIDTRKTTPGMRFFEKYAVRIGGGYNHRFGLFDGILIKDNHLAVTGGVREAIKLAKLNINHMLKIEVEAKNIREVKEALSAGADVIMLDNMPLAEIKNAVKIIRLKRPEIIIEVSGNINIGNVREVAKTGVDLISIGAITHSAPAPDISMKIFKKVRFIRKKVETRINKH